MAFRPLDAASEDTVVEDAPRRGFKPLDGVVIDEPVATSEGRSFIDTVRKVVGDFGSAVTERLPQATSNALSQVPASLQPIVQLQRRLFSLPAPTDVGMFDRAAGVKPKAPESVIPGVQSTNPGNRMPGSEIGPPREPLTAPGAIADAARKISGQVTNPVAAPVVRGVVGAVDQLYGQGEGVARLIADATGMEKAGDYFTQSRVERDAAAGNVRSLGGIPQFAQEAVQNIVANAPFYWMGMGPLKNAVTPTQVATMMESFAVTKAPTLAMAVGAGGASYNDPARAHLSGADRLASAASDAFWEYLGEQLGFGETIKALKTRGMAGEALTQRLKALAGESLGEGITEVGQIDNRMRMGITPDMTPSQILANVAQAAVMGAVVSGGMQAAGAAGSRIGADRRLDFTQMGQTNTIADLARQLLSDSETFDPGITSAGMRPVPQNRPGTVPRPPYLPGAEGTPPVLPGDLVPEADRLIQGVREILANNQPAAPTDLPVISPDFLDNGTPMIVQGRKRGRFAGDVVESATPIAALPAPSQIASSPDQQIRPSETIQGRQDDTEAITAAVRSIIGQQQPARDVTPQPPAPQPEPKATEYTARPTEKPASAFVGDRAALGPSEDVARVLQAAQTPAFARTAEDISILRRYPDLAQAATTPGFQRTAEQTALVKRAEQDAKGREDRSFDQQDGRIVDLPTRTSLAEGLDDIRYVMPDGRRIGGANDNTHESIAKSFTGKADPDAFMRQSGAVRMNIAADMTSGRPYTVDIVGEPTEQQFKTIVEYVKGAKSDVTVYTPNDVIEISPNGRVGMELRRALRGAFDSGSDRIVDDRTPSARSVKSADGADLPFKSPLYRDTVKRLTPAQQSTIARAIEELGPTLAPPDVIDGLTFASRDGPAHGSFFPDQGVITLSPRRLRMLASADALDRQMGLLTLSHEIAHAMDFAAGTGRDAASMPSDRLSSGFDDTDTETTSGDLFDEAFNAWANAPADSDLRRILTYPFAGLGQIKEQVVRLELFAQVSALYNVNTQLVRDTMPTWATTLEQIYGNPETGEGAPQSADEVSQRLREALSNEGAGARAEERVPESQTDRSANAVGPGPARGPPRPGVGTPPRAGAQPAGQRTVGGGPRGPGAAAGATAGPTWGLNEPSLRDRLLREWQDKFIDVKRVREEMQRAAGLLTEGNNAYLAEELYHGRVSARVNKATRQHIEPLLDAMKATKITADELGRYLWARHAPERNKQMAKVNPGGPGNLSGLYDDAAAAARDGNPGAPNAADIIAGFRGRMGDLNRLAAMVDGITRATQQIIVSEGLEAQATVDAWNNAYKQYVPLMRDTEAASAGQGFKVTGPESKRAMGSQKEAIAILAAVISQHERAIIRAERAKVGRTLVQMAEDNPNPDFWKVDTPPMKRTINPSTGLVQVSTDPLYRQRDDVFIVKDKGPNGTVIERVITFNPSNERAMAIAQAMNNLGVVQLGAVTKIVGRISRLLANLATSWNPQFWVTNAARDVQTAAVNLQDTELRGRAPQVIANIPKAMAGILSVEKGAGTSQWAQTYRAFQDAGGQTGWMQMWDDLRDRHQAIAKQLDRANRAKLDPREIGHKALEYIELANTAIENAIRVSAFAEAKKIGLTDKRAASIAKNMTVNFNRKGNRSVAANAWYMFFNASVQGTARLVQAVATSRRARLYAGMMVGFSAALELMNRMLWDDDRDPEGNVRYELIPEYVRQKNMIFMLPDGKHVAIPLPYGFNVFHSVGRLMAEAILTASGSSTVQERRKPSELAWAFTQTVMDSFVPLGSAGSPLQYAAPTIADPFVQYLENKTFFGSPMRPEPLPMSGPMPDYKQYFRSTSDTAKDLARWLSTTTGGDERQGGAIDISPTTIEHIVKTATGGTGQFGLVMLDFSRHVIDRALGEAEPEDYPARRIPFVGKFYGEVDDRDMAGKYYRLREDATKSLKLLKAYQQDGDLEAAAKVEDEKGPLIAMAREISSQQYRRSMSEIRKQFQALDGLPADERAKERRMLQRDEATLMARALRAYNEAQESAR